mmetsp:Transcript_77282/g.151614  ORF Transcript_77282/g.151614 Transcript_77282/m.151614 type:complete len:164 (-) Transcript_77282:212-703(-)
MSTRLTVSGSFDDEPQPQQRNLSGYLHKKSTNGEWQKRYFEINGSYLTYYKSQKMSKLLAALSIQQVGAIKLLGESDEGAEFRIDIKDRQYILRASNQKEAQAWVDALISVRDSGMSSNPLNSRPNSLNSIASRDTERSAASATVQKSVRNGCLSCLMRACGW